MPSKDNRNTDAPSNIRVRVLWVLAALTMLATLLLVKFDGGSNWREVLGFLLGVLATGLVVREAADQTWRRDAARWASEQRAEYDRAVRAAKVVATGTWHAPDGAEAYIARTGGLPQAYAVGGTLPILVDPGFMDLEHAHHAATKIEAAGYWPATDEQTRFIRRELMLEGN